MADTPATSSPQTSTQSNSSTENISTNVQGALPGSTPPVAEKAVEVLTDPNATKAEKQAAQKMLNKLMIKVDGEEFEETLPYEIPDTPEAVEYTKKQLQLAKMSHKRAQEKSQIEKDALELIQMLKTDPEAVLSDPTIGIDVKEFVAKFMEKEIERSKKSPEQLQLEEAQAELKKIKEEKELAKKESDEREHQAKVEKYTQEYDQQISEAFQTNQIPKSAIALKIIGDYLETSIAAGKDIGIKDIIPLVREELNGNFQKHLEALPDDEFENFIGKDRMDRLRKRNIAKAKAATNPALNGNKVPSTGKVAEKEPEKKLTIKQWLKV